MTSMLPCQPAYTPTHTTTRVRPPASDDTLTSALPRQLVTRATMSDPVHAHMQAHTFSRSMNEPACTQSTVTSALPRPPIAPGDFAYYTMQRPADRVDSRNMYTNSVEQLLADLSRPPPMARQPLLPDSIDTSFDGSVPCLPVTQPTVHDYQNISANLSLPSVSTHTNVPTHVSAPLSYADNSQRLPIAVEQPGFSAFSRVDVQHSRPAIADSTVQYAICTSATADHVRPIVTAYTAPLQSPPVHWRKRFAYDYVQPDTGLGAPTYAAPAFHSGYIRPQTSDTHTLTQNSVHLQTTSFGEGHSMTGVGPPRPQPPPTSYLPHSHMMPLQVPTVPSVVPPSLHLPFQVPISSSSETNVTYLHVPQTHTVFADVHAPCLQHVHVHYSLFRHTSQFMPPQVHPLYLRSHSLLLSLHNHTLSCIHNHYRTQQLILMLCQLD